MQVTILTLTIGQYSDIHFHNLGVYATEQLAIEAIKPFLERVCFSYAKKRGIETTNTPEEVQEIIEDFMIFTDPDDDRTVQLQTDQYGTTRDYKNQIIAYHVSDYVFSWQTMVVMEDNSTANLDITWEVLNNA